MNYGEDCIRLRNDLRSLVATQAANNAICMIQKAHCKEPNFPRWREEWGYKVICSCCTDAKAGVCILLNNNFDQQ